MKHPLYIADADRAGATEAYIWLSEFYTRYPSGKEIAEALHQVRRDLDLIAKEEIKKPRRTAKTAQAIDEEDK
jgi:hypothetical protein